MRWLSLLLPNGINTILAVYISKPLIGMKVNMKE